MSLLIKRGTKNKSLYGTRAMTNPASTSPILESGTVGSLEFGTAAALTSTSAGIIPQPVTPPFAQLITIKLKRENYLLWKSQMIPCLMSYADGLCRWIQGCPAGSHLCTGHWKR